MSFELEKEIFCHDLKNPPAQDRKCDINVEFVSSNRLLTITKKDVTSSETIYSIKIPDAIAIGFTTNEQYILQNEFAKLILAFNLLLQRVCITYKKSDFSSYNIIPIVPKGKTMVKKIAQRFEVNVTEYGAVTDHIGLAVDFSEEIEEQSIIDLFQKIQKLKRFEINNSSSLHDINLRDSFENYEGAMFEYKKLFKFKYIYNALGLVTNLDGGKKEGSDFDKEVGKLCGVSEDKVKTWRNFYNRIKHVQKNKKDVITYYEGITKLTDYLTHITKCVQMVLISKLM